MKLDQVKVGMTLIADSGFTCLDESEQCLVRADEKGGLYIHCRKGFHYLDGQIDDDGKLIGLEAVK